MTKTVPELVEGTVLQSTDKKNDIYLMIFGKTALSKQPYQSSLIAANQYAVQQVRADIGLLVNGISLVTPSPQKFHPRIH